MKNIKITKLLTSVQQNPAVLLLFGLVLLGICYGAASWAIDNGRLSLYAVTFISLIMGIKYMVQGIKQLIRN